MHAMQTHLSTSSSFTVPSGVVISRRAAHRINLLYSSRSRVSLVIRSMLSLIHFVKLLLYDVVGLPRLRFPLTTYSSIFINNDQFCQLVATGLPGEENCRRFDRSNGLDTALYKTYLYLFILDKCRFAPFKCKFK